MVTFRYFFNCFVFLVLQFSVFIYAQDQPVLRNASLPEEPSTAAIVESTLSPSTNDSSTSSPLQVNVTNTDNANNANKSNLEFPKDPQVGNLPVYNLNETRETPPNANVQVNCNMTDPSKTDTEVSELLNSTEIKEIEEETVKVTDDISKSPNLNFNSESIDTEVELIDDGNKEEVLRSASHQQANAPGVPLVQGQLAAILAAVFVVISVIAYIALLSWRRYLENRYGDRQMLVNENELNDRDDLRHFSI